MSEDKKREKVQTMEEPALPLNIDENYLEQLRMDGERNGWTVRDLIRQIKRDLSNG